MAQRREGDGGDARVILPGRGELGPRCNEQENAKVRDALDHG